MKIKDRLLKLNENYVVSFFNHNMGCLIDILCHWVKIFCILVIAVEKYFTDSAWNYSN